jgi:putative transposase
MMCRLLEVSRSGYYDWCSRAESARSRRNRELTMMIRQPHLESNGVYGTRKIHRGLMLAGEACVRQRVARLMLKDLLKGCPNRRFRRPPNTTADHPVAMNLLKQDFKADGPNQRWASDITQVWTREGWLYLSVVMDLCSRRIVGWAMDRAVGRHLVVGALAMAPGYRQPDGPLVHHSDRGPQYTSDDFRDICRDNGIECRMSARGSCYENAVVESFFASMKRERCKRMKYKTREEAKADIFDYMERFYNRRRSNAYLGYLSPVKYQNRSMGT